MYRLSKSRQLDVEGQNFVANNIGYTMVTFKMMYNLTYTMLNVILNYF